MHIIRRGKDCKYFLLLFSSDDINAKSQIMNWITEREPDFNPDSQYLNGEIDAVEFPFILIKSWFTSMTFEEQEFLDFLREIPFRFPNEVIIYIGGED